MWLSVEFIIRLTRNEGGTNEVTGTQVAESSRKQLRQKTSSTGGVSHLLPWHCAERQLVVAAQVGSSTSTNTNTS